MTSNKNTNQIQGFTLVELLLAMTGVAILLVAVATTTIQLMNMYHKGITRETVCIQVLVSPKQAVLKKMEIMYINIDFK